MKVQTKYGAVLDSIVPVSARFMRLDIGDSNITTLLRL